MNGQQNIAYMKKKLEELNVLEKKEKAKLEQLQEKREVLKALETKEKEKLEKMHKKKERKKTPKKRSTGKYITKGITALALTGILMAGGNKILESRNKNKDKEMPKKEITIIETPEKNQEIEKNTIIIDDFTPPAKETITKTIPKNITENNAPVKQEEEKKQVTTTKKTYTPEKQKKIEKDIFIIIDQYDPNIDPKMYSNRKGLSHSEKNIVKGIYNQLMETQNEQKTQNIIDEIQDLRILRGLRDVVVKKIIVTEKQKKDVTWLQKISQITVKKEYQMINQSISNTQNIIMKYTIRPNNFSIQTIGGLNNANNIEGGIQVHFMLKNNGEDMGTISFDNNGKLLTTSIHYNTNIYKITQDGTHIYISESQLATN